MRWFQACVSSQRKQSASFPRSFGFPRSLAAREAFQVSRFPGGFFSSGFSFFFEFSFWILVWLFIIIIITVVEALAHCVKSREGSRETPRPRPRRKGFHSSWFPKQVPKKQKAPATSSLPEKRFILVGIFFQLFLMCGGFAFHLCHQMSS